MGKVNPIPRPDKMEIFIVFKGMFSSGNKDYFFAFLGHKQRKFVWPKSWVNGSRKKFHLVAI